MREERAVIINGAYEQATSILGSVDNKEDHIQNDIIPRMDERRGRNSPISRLEIIRKLFNVPPKKSGEVYELIVGELLEKGFDLTPYLASEVADIVYYTSQPRCPEYAKDPSPYFNSLGLDIDLARSFCILKYETRLNFGDERKHKEIENIVLERFISQFYMQRD